MRGVIKKMRLTDHHPALTTNDTPFEDGRSAKGWDVNGGEGRNKKVIHTIYCARRNIVWKSEHLMRRSWGGRMVATKIWTSRCVIGGKETNRVLTECRKTTEADHSNYRWRTMGANQCQSSKKRWLTYLNREINQCYVHGELKSQRGELDWVNNTRWDQE